LTEDRAISTASDGSAEEQAFDRALRRRGAEFIGQSSGQLGIFIEAARGRAEALDHVLLFGPPGLGEPRSPTSSRTGGRAVAQTAGRFWNAPAIWRRCSPRARDVLFVDEIHRPSPAVEEILYRRWRTTGSTS
jgi:Holliday junction DNA helicase RuvB